MSPLARRAEQQRVNTERDALASADEKHKADEKLRSKLDARMKAVGVEAAG